MSNLAALLNELDSASMTNAFILDNSCFNITQPALTRRIKKMEEDLHIQLFERTTRKVTLTKAGKRLLPPARRVSDSENR